MFKFSYHCKIFPSLFSLSFSFYMQYLINKILRIPDMKLILFTQKHIKTSATVLICLIHRTFTHIVWVFWSISFKPKVNSVTRGESTPLPSSTCTQIPAYPVWGSIAVWAVLPSAVCTALGGKTPVIPWRPEDLAGPDRAECPANDLFDEMEKQSLKKCNNVESITIPGTPLP